MIKLGPERFQNKEGAFKPAIRVIEEGELLGKNVKDLILEEIKTANYFSILLDSTPDVSHID